jgi:SAM-dependent methyltransferase
VCSAARLVERFPARKPSGTVPASFACTNFGHRHHQPIWACAECGLLIQWPQPSHDQLLASYGDVEDEVYVAESENRHLTFRRAVAKLGPPAGRRLLDVGSYCGYFLDAARDAGFRAEGLELSRWAAGVARERDHTVHTETLEQRVTAGATYDVVTMWDVIEHMDDPVAELTAVHRLLAPGGQVWVSTIDSGSRAARLLGSRWPWLMDMHLLYFDRRNLGMALEKAGFTDVEFGLYTHVVSGRYLLQKVAASFRPLGPLAAAVRRLTPRRVRVPVNLGDTKMVSARKRA